VLSPPLEPMLAKPVERLPAATALPGGCAYEPKFDGYRALLFISEQGCVVQSRRGKDITRSFPELAEAATHALTPGTVLDGELVILGTDGVLDFAALQRRITGAARARSLAVKQPASFVAFDLLHAADADLRELSLAARRRTLETLLSEVRPPLQFSPQTTDPHLAASWLKQYAHTAVGLEGLVVKGLADRYQHGRRGWLKVRVRNTVEVLVGAVIGSRNVPERLVLALYDPQGQLFVVGGTGELSRRERDEIAHLLAEPRGDHPWPPELPTGRMGRFGGGKVAVQLVDPTLVVEVSADNAFEQGKWRHLTRFVRTRPDLTASEVPTVGER
jgi:ATP-dependent DNA ligase